jgi:membrane-bound serine protease (ClpP class)
VPRTLARITAGVLLVVGLLGLTAGLTAGADDGAPVYVLPSTGIVDGVMAGYIADGIARAEADGSPAIVVKLDTPGGSLSATEEIYSALLEATVPPIVWVAPAGAKAASAGTFITLAGAAAYMAPGTNIGAASPVGSGGEDIEGTLGDKVRNDAIAAISSIAETRGRPIDWAVSTVAEAKSYTAREAAEAGAVDGIASTVEEVLAQADGLEVTQAGQPMIIQTAGAPVEELPMNPLQGLLHLLSDPNIAFLLFTLGFYGLLFELQSPNFVTGILGALAIILGFVGFGSLPLNVAGLLLIGLGIVLFVLELTVTSHGLLTIGGLIAFFLGASALYTTPGNPTAPDVTVAFPVVLAMTGTTAAFMAVVVAAALRSRRLRAGATVVGEALPSDAIGEVRQPLDPIGSVWLNGEDWTARAAEAERLDRGVKVRVISRDGLTLVVAPLEKGVPLTAPPGPGGQPGSTVPPAVPPSTTPPPTEAGSMHAGTALRSGGLRT